MRPFYRFITFLVLVAMLFSATTMPGYASGENGDLEQALRAAVGEALFPFGIPLINLQFDWITLTIDLGPGFSGLGLSEQENVVRAIDLAVNAVLDQRGYADQRSFSYYFLSNGMPVVPLSEPVADGLSAQSIQGQRVVLSPGHGWYDYGDGTWRLQRGYWWGIVEDFINPELVMLINQKLQGTGADLRPVRQMDKSVGGHSSGHPWWEVDASEYVRNLGAPWSVWNAGFNGIDRDIVARPEYANWISANAYVSIHNNGGGGCGTETWYDTSNGYQAQSLQLAQAIQNKLIERIRAQWNANWCNRGVKGANGSYGEIRRFRGPGVIVELGFMDNQSDNSALQNAQFRDIAATAIRDAIVEYFGGAGGGTTIPSGFYQLQNDTGVSLYRKDYSPGQPDYVQLVDLSQGAAVLLLHGGIADNGTGQGAYGGNNPKFNRMSLDTAWSNFSAATSGAFCVTNGQFFSIQDPAPLAFPLKKDGQILSDGYGSTSEYQGQLYMLEIWSDHADIRPLSKDALYNSSAPNILGGLSENADKSMTSYVGRTFAGIDDANGDGTYERILLFNSAYARQVDASNVLYAFGADKVIMFDGGGSTQLKCGVNSYIPSARAVPQTLAVRKGGVTPPVTGNWHVEYFNSKDLNNRCYDSYENSTYIFKNWQEGAPASGCNTDNFSARFTSTVNFSGGNYSVHCQHDDGCKVFIDGQEKLNAWWDSAFSGHDWGGAISGGNHEVRIEFYDAGGAARLETWWSGLGFLPSGQACNAGEWCAEYFGNRDLAGTPALRLNEGTGTIDHTWNDGGPGYGFPTDSFSVRWQRTVSFQTGRYRFHIKSDDGGRLWVNNALVIDQWKDQGLTEYTVDLDMAGVVPLKFEYYENSGGAVAQMWWDTLSLTPPGAFGKSSPASGATGQSTSPTISWGAASNATIYEYCFDTSNDNACSTWVSSGANTSAALSGLSAGTTYYWQARASNGGGTTYADGSASAFRAFSTQSVVIPAPDLAISAVTVPASAYTNDSTLIKIDLSNVTAYDAASFWVDLYVDDQPTGCGDWGSYWGRISSLAANSALTIYLKIPGQSLSAGTHQIRAYVDSGCEVTETNDGNNFFGPISIQITNPPAPAPNNDDFDAASWVYGSPVSNTLGVSGATQSDDDPALTICNRNPGTKSVWYAYTPPTKQQVFIDTFSSNYDTMIGVWTGTRGNLSEITCNDDSPGMLQSQVNFTALAGTTYFIGISKYDGVLPSLDAASSLDSRSEGQILQPEKAIASDLAAQEAESLSINLSTKPFASLVLYSAGAYDGWILESSETSSQGGTLNVTGTTLLVGDAVGDKQYRSILSFDTAGLPDNAVILSANLKLRKQSLVGTNPFGTHLGMKFDIRKPYFGTASGLAASDFQAAASLQTAGSFSNTLVNGWYAVPVGSTASGYINKTGLTQFRIRFAKDDNDDNGADYFIFYSGNYGTSSYRPTLVIEYYVP